MWWTGLVSWLRVQIVLSGSGQFDVTLFKERERERDGVVLEPLFSDSVTWPLLTIVGGRQRARRVARAQRPSRPLAAVSTNRVFCSILTQSHGCCKSPLNHRSQSYCFSIHYDWMGFYRRDCFNMVCKRSSWDLKDAEGLWGGSSIEKYILPYFTIHCLWLKYWHPLD